MCIKQLTYLRAKEERAESYTREEEYMERERE